jgi:hypothetical protein
VRPYFYNPEQKVGVYPLDQQLKIAGSNHSPALEKQAVKLSACLPYEQAEELLRELSGLNVSDSTIWHITQAAGERLEQHWQGAVQAHFEVNGTNTKPKLGSDPPPFAERGARQGVGMDGVMIHIRGEGYKETKLGCLFEIEQVLNKEGESGAGAVGQSYNFYLGEPEEFGRRLWLEAQGRNWELAQAREVVGDGARWVWNLGAEHFGGAVEVVDWYHAKQHLWQAAKLLHGEGSLKATNFVAMYEDLLYQGEVERVASGIELNLKELKQPVSEEKAELIEREANYFRTNRTRMAYKQCREAGFVIGSGMVESGCKLFKQRFGGSGMRWSRGGATNLMPLRAAVMSHSFDQLWHLLCPQN